MRRPASVLAIALGSVLGAALAPARAREDAEAAPSAPVDSLPAYMLETIEIRADVGDRSGPLPLSVTRFGRAEIDRRPGGTLGGLLADVAGLRIASRGLDGADAQVSIRGSATDQVVFLVDGRRIGTAQGGGVDVSTLPLQSIESVEVARGGASALWGADAIGGAVNIRTRPPRPGAALRVGGGSFGHRSLAGELGWRAANDWALRVAARTWRTDGAFPYHDDETGERRTVTNGDMRRTDGEVRAEGELVGLHARFDVSGLAGRRGIPGSEEFPTPSARLSDARGAAGLSLTQTDGAWRSAVDISGSWQTRRYLEPAAAFGPLDDEHRNQRGRLEVSVNGTLPHASVLAAAGVASDRLRSTTDGKRSRDAADLRVQAARDLVVGSRVVRGLGALRWDASAGDAAFLSPRLGVSTDLLPGGVTLAVSGGLSFRPPSFDELFWPPRASAAGNPDLAAERGHDLDVSLAWPARSRPVHATVSAFAREVTDLIQWIPGADGVWRPHNLARARLRGIEAEGGTAFGIFGERTARLTGAASWLRSRDESGEANVEGKELPYRPRWTMSASAALSGIGGGELELRVRGTAAAWITRANTKRLPGRTTLGFAWQRPLAHGLRLDTSVENVTDVAARDFRDYPLPGRSVTAGLSWQGGAA